MGDEPEYKTRKEPGPIAWWWGLDYEGPLYGPHDTKKDAMVDMEESSYFEDRYEGAVKDDEYKGTFQDFLGDWEVLGEYQRPSIGTDIFDADWTLECLEEKNEEAVWHEATPVWPRDKQAELERMLADTLYRWLDKHDLWKEFRALS